MDSFMFPVGYKNFHSDELLNFQMNRWYSGGLARYEDFKEIGKEIEDFDDWKKAFIKIGAEAEKENRLLNAFIYYRGAEFFAYPSDTGKECLYDKCIDLFYEAVKDESVERLDVPYEGGYMSVLRLPAKEPKKGTILIHGGYDSFNEEFYPLSAEVTNYGYDVIVYEGPGQGRTLHKHNLTMTHQWEKPTKVILDYFKLSDVTLIGVSLGGYLAAQAAAFDSRISRVVLFDIIYDFFEAMLKKYNFVLRKVIPIMLELKMAFVINFMEKRIRSKSLFTDWLLSHGFYVYGVESLYEFWEKQKKFNTKGISHLIEQDVLMLGGTNDPYTPFFEAQRKALVNARSVTGRIFTEEEHASHHCQVGNLKLTMDYILNWIEEIK